MAPIADGTQVLHRCDTPRCCNHEHLFLGTQLENMADMARKGRARNQHAAKAKAGLVVDPDTGCHVWTGRNGGYGNVRFATHRLAWELAHGSIPDGLKVLHRCDNSLCCNPDHMFLATQAENLAVYRERRARNDPRRCWAAAGGHPRTQPAGGKTRKIAKAHM